MLKFFLLTNEPTLWGALIVERISPHPPALLAPRGGFFVKKKWGKIHSNPWPLEGGGI